MGKDRDTMVLRKEGHWFVLDAPSAEARREMILRLVGFAEHRQLPDVPLEKIQPLVESLGWELRVFGRSSENAA